MTREELLTQAKPILFNTEMVKAILEGRKTVTRRVIKRDISNQFDCEADGTAIAYIDQATGDSYKPWEVCRFKKGDYLYVRETWTEEYKEFYYRADYDSDYLEPCETLSGGYPADCRYYPGCVGCTRGRQRIMWHPSIHMPKEAARLFLKVTDVRVERLQECGKGWCLDIEKEGVVTLQAPILYVNDDEFHEALREEFHKLWDSTIKKADLDKYGWEVNPWVCVIEFERVI